MPGWSSSARSSVSTCDGSRTMPVTPATPCSTAGGGVAAAKRTGRFGNSSSAMAQHELQRRRGVRDHQVELAIGKLDADGVGQRRVRRFREFLVLQVLRVRVDLDRGVREQALPQRRVERRVSRECRRAAVNDQHALDRAWANAGARRREARDDRHGHETARERSRRTRIRTTASPPAESGATNRPRPSAGGSARSCRTSGCRRRCPAGRSSDG